MAVPSEKAFTMNAPQFEKFQRVAARQKPGTDDWSITDVIAGWVTVRVPHWIGGARAFHEVIRER